MPGEGTRYRIRIDPELKRLRSGVILPETVTAAHDFAATRQSRAPRPQPDSFRLRRDGLRPLCFEGLFLLSMPLLGQIGDCVRFYLASDDRIAMQVVASLSDARPRYLAAFIADPSELAAIFACLGPSLSWEAAAPVPPGAL